MQCHNCSAIVAGGARFCKNCGSAVSLICPQCGRSHKPNATFCGGCGVKIGGGSPATPQPDVQPQPPPPPPQTAQWNPPPPSGVVGQAVPQPGPVAYAGPAMAFQFKGVGPRCIAILIDLILISIISFVIGFVFGFMSGGMSEPPAIMFVIISVMILVYFVAFEAKGATPGKRILGMKVIDKNGQPPGAGKSLVRNLLRIVDFLPFAYILGAIFVASSKAKQRIGDRAAGTYVVGR